MAVAWNMAGFTDLLADAMLVYMEIVRKAWDTAGSIVAWKDGRDRPERWLDCSPNIGLEW